MEGHEPGMLMHYDLHAWVWRHNELHLRAWNPIGALRRAAETLRFRGGAAVLVAPPCGIGAWVARLQGAIRAGTLRTGATHVTRGSGR